MKQEKKNTDKRCMKTRIAIRTALATLISQKDITHITVKDISDHALISRNTFYAHYDSVYTLMDEIEEETLAQLIEVLEENDLETILLNPYIVFNKLTTLINDDFEFYKHMVNSPLTNSLLDKIKEIAKLYGKKQVSSIMHLTDELLDLSIEYCLAGILGVYKLWFNSDRTTSLDDLSKHCTILVTNGVLGINTPHIMNQHEKP